MDWKDWFIIIMMFFLAMQVFFNAVVVITFINVITRLKEVIDEQAQRPRWDDAPGEGSEDIH